MITVKYNAEGGITVSHTVDGKSDGTVVNGEKADSVKVSFANTYEKPNNPITGDDTPIILAGSLMLISLAAIVLLMTKKRKGGKSTA